MQNPTMLSRWQTRFPMILVGSTNMDLWRSMPRKVGIMNTGSTDVTIAIVDTGIDLTHIDLVDKLVPGINIMSILRRPTWTTMLTAMAHMWLGSQPR